MRSQRFSALIAAAVALSGFGCSNDPSGPPTTVAGQFDAFWSTFDREYSYFDYKHINWDALRAEFRPQALAAASTDALVPILKEMVEPLRDVHVYFTSPAGVVQPTYTPTATVNWTHDVWLETITDCGFTQAKPNLGHCRIGDIAYVTIGAWNESQFSVADLDGVFAAVQSARAMIIDVRPNAGGNDALAFAFAGRFTATSVVAGSVVFREGGGHSSFGREIFRRIEPRGPTTYTKPVVVLSGRGVFSSNESFVSGMRELPNVTIVGDTTGGGSGNPRSHALGGGWHYTVSRWIEFTADHLSIEWQGIPPDEYVAWDAALVAQKRDPVLERALQLLGG